MKEQLLLELRNAIADKEWNIACANMETARAGEWTCDWHEGIRLAEDRITEILNTLNDEFQPTYTSQPGE